MQNIGIAFVELNQYADAVTSFEQVMSDSPSLGAGRHWYNCPFEIVIPFVCGRLRWSKMIKESNEFAFH
jgi:hypothetical protein